MVDIPDEGFTERIIRQLPERKSIIPQVIVIFFSTLGLAITLAIHGITPLLEQLNSLFTSISLLQAPSPVSVITYLGVMFSTGIIGYAVYQADAG